METGTQISVATIHGCFFFNTEEIIRLEASSNYTNIFFTNRKKLLTARILKDYETILEPFGFLRTHRSHLVNRKYIRFVDGKGNITMQDTSVAEISRRKKNEVLKALKAA